jgi:hypothetical protein
MSYHSDAQQQAYCQSLQTQFPTKVSHESIGKTVQGKDIILWKFGKQNGPRLLFTNEHHNERTAQEVYWHYLHWLFENREPGLSDWILKNVCTGLIWTINPDGGRGNANNVNLNRNFPKSWRTDCVSDPQYLYANPTCPTGLAPIDSWGCYPTGKDCSCGGTWNDVPTSEKYRGVGPGSEPETQAFLAFLRNWKPKFVLDYHTWVDPPAFWKPSWRSGINATDRAYHDAVIQKIKNLATQRKVRVYSYGQTGICGSLIDDAYATGGATSFMLEGLGKNECGGYVNPPYNLITDIAFPAFLPAAIVFSIETAGYPPPPPFPLLPILIIGGIIILLTQRR